VYNTYKKLNNKRNSNETMQRRMDGFDRQKKREVRCMVADKPVHGDQAHVRTRVVSYLSATVGRALPMGFGRRKHAGGDNADPSTTVTTDGVFLHQIWPLSGLWLGGVVVRALGL